MSYKLGDAVIPGGGYVNPKANTKESKHKGKQMNSSELGINIPGLPTASKVEMPWPDYRIKFKKLDPNAIIPTRGSEEAAGLDLCALEEKHIYPGEVVAVPTGLSIAIPKGYFGAVCSRSGNVFKWGLVVANQPGIIDSDYRGEIKVLLTFLGGMGTAGWPVEKGQRIAQLIIQPYLNTQVVEVAELDDTARGSGGFGSTGV